MVQIVVLIILFVFSAPAAWAIGSNLGDKQIAEWKEKQKRKTNRS